MKLHTYFILPVLAVILSSLTACNDLLDENPKYTLNSKTIFQSADSAEMALLGCYGYLSSVYGQEMQEVPIAASGLTWGQRKGDFASDLTCLNIQPTNDAVNLLWNILYKTIAECNAFIASIDESTLNSNVKTQQKGEAKFIRALCYYDLAVHFGDVPLRVSASSSDNIAAQRTPIKQVFDLIVADFTDATHIATTSKDGRANAWAAKAYLAKAYYKMACLGIDTQTNLLKAKEMFDEVYKNGPYALDPSFSKLFGTYVTDCKESIFQINYSTVTTSGPFNRGSNRFAPQASTTGVNWSSYRVSKANYDLHEGTYPGDPRIKTTFLTQWRTRAGNNQANPKKQVGTILTANDSTYTYPYWTYASAKNLVPGTKTKLMNVAKLPYDDFADRTNPNPDVLNNYVRQHGKTENNQQMTTAVNKFTSPGNSNKWPFYGKMYDQTQSAQMSHQNLIIFRFAEFLLNMADCYNDLGKTTQAATLVNLVLSRARHSDGASATQPVDISTSISQEVLRERIYFEYIFELNGEPTMFETTRQHGEKLLKKLLEYTNKHHLINIANKRYATNVNNFLDFVFNNGQLDDNFLRRNLLLPIPQSEIDTNAGISSNDNNFGYTTK